MRLFSASWCGYCKHPKDYIVDNNLPVVIVDIDMYPEEAVDAGVRGIPTLQKDDGTLLTESREIVKYLQGEFE